MANWASLLRESGFPQVETYDPFVPRFAQKPAGRFDCVICFEVLEHATDPLSTLGDMVEFLTDTGLIVLSTLLQPADIDRRGLSWWYAAPRNAHISLYTKASLDRLLEPLGFQVHSLGESYHVLYRQNVSLGLAARLPRRLTSRLSSEDVRGQLRELHSQPFPPLGRLLGLAPDVVEFHQAIAGLGQPWLPPRRDLGLAGLHSLVAGEQQRLGQGVLHLAQKAAAKHAPRIEGRPSVGLRTLADRQAFPQQRLGIGPFLQHQKGPCERGHRRDSAGVLRAEMLPGLLERVAIIRLGRAELLGGFVGLAKLGRDERETREHIGTTPARSRASCIRAPPPRADPRRGN